MTNFFPLGIFFWLASWLLKEYKKEEPIRENTNTTEDIGPIWRVQYYSNGRLLFNRHLFYYFDLLQLTGMKELTDEVIQDAAAERYALINKIDYDENWPIATRDVNAAKAYLMDRWDYMTNLN